MLFNHSLYLWSVDDTLGTVLITSHSSDCTATLWG